MVLERGDQRVVPLSSSTLQCMTQGQLEELIPQLITKATGQKPPQFGSQNNKPSWWPRELEWTTPARLAGRYQDPCAKLREIVRCCYCHMDEDVVLTSVEEVEEIPSSPEILSETEKDCVVQLDSSSCCSVEEMSPQHVDSERSADTAGSNHSEDSREQAYSEDHGGEQACSEESELCPTILNVYSLGDIEDTSESSCSRYSEASTKHYARSPTQVIEITEDSQETSVELPDIASSAESITYTTFSGVCKHLGESVHSKNSVPSANNKNKPETDLYKSESANSPKPDKEMSPVMGKSNLPCTNSPTKDNLPKVGKAKSLSVQLVDIRVGIGSSTSVKLKGPSANKEKNSEILESEKQDLSERAKTEDKKDNTLESESNTEKDNSVSLLKTKVTSMIKKEKTKVSTEQTVPQTQLGTNKETSNKHEDKQVVHIIEDKCTKPFVPNTKEDNNNSKGHIPGKSVNIPNEKTVEAKSTTTASASLFKNKPITGSIQTSVGATASNKGAGDKFEISDEMIAEIDQEIAKSLQNALGGFCALAKPVKKRGRPPKVSLSLYDELFKTTDSLIKTKGKKPNILRKPMGHAEKHILSDSEQAQSLSDSEVSLRQVTKRRRTSEDLDPSSPSLSNDPTTFQVKLDSMQKAVQDAIDKLERSAKLDVPTLGPTAQIEGKGKKSTSVEDRHEDEVVWICFMCAKSFADQAQLMTHQDMCEESLEPSDSDVIPLKPTETAISQQGGSKTSSPFLPGRHSISPEVNKVKSSEGGVHHKLTGVRRPSPECVQSSQPQPKPVPTLLRKVGSNLKSLPLGLPVKARMAQRRLKRPPDVYIPPSRDVYFDSLGLCHTPKAQVISQSPRKSVTDKDCQIIDLTIDDGAPLAVPMTPRSRSLMSQLSRDNSIAGRRRQISFSQDGLHSSKSPLSPMKHVKKEASEEPSESESSSEEEETSKRKVKTLSKSAILGIPLTSPLGQRLKKHWNFETKIPIITDYEQHCKTDPQQIVLEVLKERNPMAEKLRNRPPPQVTFRFTKKYMTKWFHKYKFSKSDRREFVKTMKFGLERESRLLLKQMKPCKVVLQRISKKNIRYWIAPKPMRVLPRLPNPRTLQGLASRLQTPKPSILQNRQYVLKRPAFAPRPLLNQQMMIRSIQPGLPGYHIPFAQSPVPQLLVRTVPVEGQGMRLQVMPTNNSTLSMQNMCARSANQEPSTLLSHNQRRKQSFAGIKDDDMVICLSSDEEEDAGKPPPCDECKVSRNNCSIHGSRRIGPASFMKNQQMILRQSEGVRPVVQQVSSFCRSQPMPQTVGQLLQQSAIPASTTQHPYLHGQSFITFNQPHIMTASVPQSTSSFTNIRISDRQATVMPRTGTDTGKVIEPIVGGNSVVAEQVDDKEQNSAGSDSEYLNYEVICIESDEES